MQLAGVVAARCGLRITSAAARKAGHWRTQSCPAACGRSCCAVGLRVTSAAARKAGHWRTQSCLAACGRSRCDGRRGYGRSPASRIAGLGTGVRRAASQLAAGRHMQLAGLDVDLRGGGPVACKRGQGMWRGLQLASIAARRAARRPLCLVVSGAGGGGHGHQVFCNAERLHRARLTWKSARLVGGSGVCPHPGSQ